MIPDIPDETRIGSCEGNFWGRFRVQKLFESDSGAPSESSFEGPEGPLSESDPEIENVPTKHCKTMIQSKSGI